MYGHSISQPPSCVWHSLYAHALLLSLRSILPPPPWYPVMYSCTSISNGRHGVFSPPLWNRISLLRFCGFPTVRAGQTRPPLPVEQDGFPFCHTHTHIHTHTPCLCECMAILSPNPPPAEQDGFPFCSETDRHTHTHTHHVSVYVWHSLSAHALLLSLRSILWCAGQAGYDTGCGTPVVGVLQASRLQALVFRGDTIGGGGAENAQRTTRYMIPVRPSPPPPPPQWFLPTPPLRCGVVVGCFPPPPCGVAWCGCGLLPPPWCGSGVGFGGSPPSPPVAWCGLGGSPLHVWICLGCLANPCS